MRVTYTVGKTTLAQECDTQAKAFEFMAECIAVFGGEPCGVCGSTDTQPSVFQTRTGVMRKFVCQKKGCGAGLMVVSRREGGGLFIGRQDRDRKPLPHNGWSIYRREQTTPARGVEPDLPENEDSRLPSGDVPF